MRSGAKDGRAAPQWAGLRISTPSDQSLAVAWQVNTRDLRSGLVRKRNKAVDKDARAAAEARNAEQPLPVAAAAEAYTQALQVLLMVREVCSAGASPRPPLRHTYLPVQRYTLVL